MNKPFVHFGMTADGSFPKAGTPVRYRCHFCGVPQEGVQPRPGRYLAACRTCARRVNEALKLSPAKK
jgi:hypothetical protein